MLNSVSIYRSYKVVMLVGQKCPKQYVQGRKMLRVDIFAKKNPKHVDRLSQIQFIY